MENKSPERYHSGGKRIAIENAIDHESDEMLAPVHHATGAAMTKATNAIVAKTTPIKNIKINDRTIRKISGAEPVTGAYLVAALTKFIDVAKARSIDTKANRIATLGAKASDDAMAATENAINRRTMRNTPRPAIIPIPNGKGPIGNCWYIVN